MEPQLTAEDVLEIALRNRNWGRWGKDDQLGTVNFIDAEAIIRAASLSARAR